MSKVLADTLQGRAAGNEAPDFPKGATVTGVVTTTDLKVGAAATVTGASTLTGHVSLGSTVGAAGSIYFPDSKGVNFGDAAEGDLSIFHDGTDSFIANTTGSLTIKNTGNLNLYTNNNEDAVVCTANGSVSLYNDGNKRIETTKTGAVVTGILTATGDIETTGGNLTVGLGKSINIDGNYDTVKIQERSVGVGTTSTAGRDAGIGTATGTMIWNASTEKLEVYNGTVWKRAAGEAITATGGSLDTSGRPGWTVHTLTASGAFNVVTGTGTIEYAFWGGGGGGSGHAGGGGGGAGGFRTGTLDVTPGPYAVTVGAGGAGGPESSGNGGGPAGNSSLTPTIIAYGGGGGGDNDPVSGKPGGSGGGAGGSNSGNLIGYGYNPTTPAPVLSPIPLPSPYPITQGHPGGVNVQPTHTGGGGGGSGAVGGAASPTQGGAGGAGAITSIPGSSTQKGGGGGAGAHNPGKTGGAGGAGGGAAGSPQGPNTKAPSASANTGSGGGGGGGTNGSAPSTGGDGGSGVMYIAYEN